MIFLDKLIFKELIYSFGTERTKKIKCDKACGLGGKKIPDQKMQSLGRGGRRRGQVFGPIRKVRRTQIDIAMYK
jgi:hypothetical protein